MPCKAKVGMVTAPGINPSPLGANAMSERRLSEEDLEVCHTVLSSRLSCSLNPGRAIN